MRHQNIAIGLTGDPVALGSANGVTVNMNGPDDWAAGAAYSRRGGV